MDNHTLEERFRSVYLPMVDDYVEKLKVRPWSDYKGIPHLFLPEWGKNYVHALTRIAIVGKETRGWNPCLDEFLPLYQSGKYSLCEEKLEFQNLDFKDPTWMGGRPTRESFWGFWMNVLAKVYGVGDWEEIKRGKFNRLLDNFAWGNANSIETSTSQGVNAGAPGYGLAKKSSLCFDSVDLLVKVLDPHVIILTCSNGERNRYLGGGFDFIETVEGRVSVFRRGKLYVLHMPHPNGQRWYAGGADVFSCIVRDLLNKYGFFCPLPDVLKNGLRQSAVDRLVHEVKGDSKYAAIAKIAGELRRQKSCMTARDLCVKVLDKAGFLTNRGTRYTGNGHGPCKLAASAWNYYQHSEKKPEIAEDIALAFTNDSGFYAYE